MIEICLSASEKLSVEFIVQSFIDYLFLTDQMNFGKSTIEDMFDQLNQA